MRTGLNFLQTLVGLTTITVLVACGDDGGGTGGGGGGDAGTGATTGNTTAGPGTGSVTSTGTSPVGPATTSTGTGTSECTATITFQDPDVDACAYANCCDELLACEEDNFANCADASGGLDPESPAGGPLVACLEANECFGAGFLLICTSNIGFEQPVDPETEEYVECFNDACCEAFAECEAGGDLCLDCILGDIEGPDGFPDFSLCDAAHACSLAACDTGLVFGPYCDSGIGSSGPLEVSECIHDSCCAEYNACTGGPYTEAELATEEAGEAVQACLDCLEAGGGALCDAAIACEETNCNTAICDSGLTIGDIELATCLSDSCCTEFTACTGGDPEDEAAVQACIDCFNAYDPEGNDPPGALCASAIACQETSCEGGTGEGGGGGGGTGGAGGAGGAGG